MSLPQIDEAFIWSSTWPCPGSGTSTVTCWAVLSPGRTTPFMVGMGLRRDRDPVRWPAALISENRADAGTRAIPTEQQAQPPPDRPQHASGAGWALLHTRQGDQRQQPREVVRPPGVGSAHTSSSRKSGAPSCTRQGRRCARCSEASFADLPSTRFSETVGAACLAKHDGQVIQLDHPGAGHHIVNHPRRYRPACAPYHLQVVGAAAGNAQGASTAAAPDPSRRAHRARADRPPWRVFPAHIAITPSNVTTAPLWVYSCPVRVEEAASRSRWRMIWRCPSLVVDRSASMDIDRATP